jgi:putative FmdB family regulatory protein
MPTYSYICNNCSSVFELFSSISSYEETPQCEKCGLSHTRRNYEIDMSTLFSSVKKGDSELKTLGDLAKRNTERMSTDEKSYLKHKHNSYKDNKPDAPLPRGMSRIQKPKKGV